MRLISLFVALLTLFSTALFAGPRRWTTSGPGKASVIQVVADPVDPDTAYARTPAGIYKTSDVGQSWRPVNDGLPGGFVAAFLAADNPPALYAGIGNVILRSTDGGAHWRRRGNLGSASITNLAYDRDSKTLLAGTTRGIYFSIDGGRTWAASVLPDYVRGIDAMVLSANAAYAATSVSYPVQMNAILRSVDGGRRWERLTDSPYLLYANPSSPSVYGIGKTAYVSDDQAKTWTMLPWPPSASVQQLVPDGADVYAATSSGVFVYSKDAAAWSLIGTAAAPARMLAISQFKPSRFYLAEQAGVLRFTEGESDWTAADEGLPGAMAVDVAVAPAESSVCYTTTGAMNVFRTDDGGADWKRLTPLSNFYHIAVSPSTGNTAYLSGPGGVLKTSDEGETWKEVTPSSATQLAVAQSDGKTLYAALSDGMSKSVDGGDTWSSIMSGMTLDYYEWYYSFGATSIAVDPSNASAVYLGRDSGLFKTTDGGAHWKRAAEKLNVRALLVDPSDSSTVYAAKDSGGLLKSTDQGDTWTSAGLVDKTLWALAMSGSRLYAGSADGHIYSSDDGGQSWNGFEAGLGRGLVSRISLDRSGNHLYAATFGGVYEYEIIDPNIVPERLGDDHLRLPDGETPGFILPVAGSTSGLDGMRFSTDLELTNQRDGTQPVLVTWIPEAGGEAPQTFHLTLPSGVTELTDLNAFFGIRGIGSLAFLAVDTSDSPDAGASIDGSAQIWTHPSGGRAPFSQSVAAVRGSALSEHAELELTQLEHDADFRTNMGIVNLSGELHQFTIQINSEHAQGEITTAVPALSLVQFAIPDAEYGTLSLNVSSDGPARWLLYGSVIDRETGGGQTFVP